MRPISRNLFRILNNERLQPVQFIDIQLAGTSEDSAFHLTDYGQAITWDGYDYVSVSMSRGGIEEVLSSESGESPQSTMTLANVDSKLAAVLSKTDLDGAAVTLWLADRRLLTRRRDALVLSMGEIREPQITGTSLIFQIVNPIGIAERTTVPKRLWQAECNYMFGSPSCGVNTEASPYTIDTPLLAGSTSRVLVVASSILSAAGNPSDPTDYWSAGYAVMQDGVCATQGRAIDKVVISTNLEFHMRYPLYATPATGDIVVLKRGCPKTTAACIARNNLPNYGGFPDVPPEKFKPVEVKDPR